MFKGMFWTQPFSRNKEMTEAVFGEIFVCFQITWTLGGGWRWIAQVEETPVRDPGWRSQVDSPGVDPWFNHRPSHKVRQLPVERGGAQ